MTMIRMRRWDHETVDWIYLMVPEDRVEYAEYNGWERY